MKAPAQRLLARDHAAVSSGKILPGFSCSIRSAARKSPLQSSAPPPPFLREPRRAPRRIARVRHRYEHDHAGRLDRVAMRTERALPVRARHLHGIRVTSIHRDACRGSSVAQISSRSPLPSAPTRFHHQAKLGVGQRRRLAFAAQLERRAPRALIRALQAAGAASRYWLRCMRNGFQEKFNCSPNWVRGNT